MDTGAKSFYSIYTGRCTSGYFNCISSISKQLEDYGLILNNSGRSRSDIYLSNGNIVLGKGDKEIHYIHRDSEFSKRCLLNISTNESFKGTFVLPPRIPKLNVVSGEYITIADYKKNRLLSRKLIDSNPNLIFKIITDRSEYLPENCNVVYKSEDIEKLLAGSKMILCLSSVDYETFGMLPMECCSSGIPTYISDNYKLPYVKTIGMNYFDEWNNVVNGWCEKSNRMNEWVKYSSYQLERFNMFCSEIKINKP